MGNLPSPRAPQFGEPQALPPQVQADVAAAFLGMPLSADYIWRGFLGRPPPAPGPRPSPHPGQAGALGFQALALSPGPGRSRPAAWAAAAAAASPARPTPGWPSPRPGPAIGRGVRGAGGGGRAGWGGGGAALWRQRTVEAGCSPVGSALSAGKAFLRPPPITWICSGEVGGYFSECPPDTHHGEGFEAGL